MKVKSSAKGKVTARNKVASISEPHARPDRSKGVRGAHSGGLNHRKRGSKSTENQAVPLWATIDPQTTSQAAFPATLGTSAFLTSTNASGVVTYSIVTPVTGFTIDSVTGVITVDTGATIAIHAIEVSATNGIGVSDPTETFNWEVTA